MNKPAEAHLFINDQNVGSVTLRGYDGAWGFGDFKPAPAFATFATYFGQWSLMMHADDGDKILSEAAHEELRRAEYAIDALRARLCVVEPLRWIEIAQLNIDGPLIEFRMR